MLSASIARWSANGAVAEASSSRRTAAWAGAGPAASAAASASTRASSASSGTASVTRPMRAPPRPHPPVREHQLRRPAHADQARQQPRLAAVGRQADAGVGRGEGGGRAGDDEVAGEREAEAAARSDALHARDDRRVERGEGEQRGVEVVRERAHRRSGIRGGREVAHVAADAERPPGGRQHDDPDVVALRQLGRPVAQRRRHRRVDRVAAVRRVELQAGDDSCRWRA